ncbi:MAG: DUF2723 domain-containing protein [Gemmatimonadaceae bacterium]
MADPSLELDYRPSYLAAGIATGLVLVLYLITLAPSTSMWDTSEYIAAAYTLGLPHPPGNPFFVILGRVVTLLPLPVSIAAKINVLAAVCGAVSAGLWFLITERVLVGWLPERWQRIAGGSIAALVGATAFTVWNQSVVSEKVYNVALVLVAIVSWLTVRWCDEPDGPKADRVLVLVAYLIGLGYANHMAGMLPVPAVGLAVLLRRWRTVTRWRLLLACFGAIVLGLTPFASQPIRAAWNPPINEGDPTACRTGLKLSCTFSSGTKDAFLYNFNRQQYGKPELSERQAPFSAQIGMWWLYFRWQWLRDAHLEYQPVQAMLAVVFLLLGFCGGYVHWRRDPRSFSYYGPLVVSASLVLIYYLNFKYGYSQDGDLGDTVQREVRDRDYFYLWSFSTWSVWAALGFVFVWESVAALFGADPVRVAGDTVEVPRRRSWMYASPVLLVAFVPLFGNWSTASRSGQTDTRDFAKDLLNSVEPYGVLVTVGDNDTFPLWYAQEVEGIRKDVTVANTSLLNTDWYVRQLIRRPTFTYDAARGPAVYRGHEWKKPEGKVFAMTLDQADSVPLYIPVTQRATFKKGALTAIISPRTLTRADYFVFRAIQDAFPDRPMYFSRTSGHYGEELGFGPFLVTQGLARKLMPSPPVASSDLVQVSGEGLFDLPRTRALWADFEAPKSIARRRDGWVDRPSVGIPALYITTGALLSDVLERAGDKAGAEKALDTALRVARATKLEGLFGPQRGQQPAPPLGIDTDRGVEVPALPAPAVAPSVPPAKVPTGK